MAKTNFTKAEEALSEALQKILRMQLLSEADTAQGIQLPNDEERRHRILMIQSMQRGLKRLYKHDKEIYKKLAVNRKELEAMLNKAETLTPEAWDNFMQVKRKVAELVKLLPEEIMSDEDLIKQQRKKHKTKRFNVNDKWLPLT